MGSVWRYGSLWRWRHGTAGDKSLLSPWPLARRPGWVERVREPLTPKEQKRLIGQRQFGERTFRKSFLRNNLVKIESFAPKGQPYISPGQSGAARAA